MKRLRIYLNIVLIFSIVIFCLSACGYDNMKTYDFKFGNREYLINAESYQIYINSGIPDDRQPDEAFDVDREVVFNVLKTQQEASFDIFFGKSYSISVIKEFSKNTNSEHLLKIKRIR